jgi:hypothetical protein
MRFLLLLSLVLGFVCTLVFVSRAPTLGTDSCAYQTADGFYLTVPRDRDFGCAPVVFVDPANYAMWR